MSQSENATDVAQNAGNETASQGPGSGLPDAAPDFVSDVLGSISAGATDLGETISDLASSANPAEVAAVAVDIAAAIPL